jgi:CRP/FNR family transcriptional regulator, anaerobic regulatory protein
MNRQGLSLRTMAFSPIAEPIFGVVASGCQAYLLALEPAMLDPAVTFASNRGHEAEIAAPGLTATTCVRPCSSPGVVATEPTLRSLFLSQLAETFAPPRAIFWEGDAARHVFHVLEGCLRVSRVLQDGRRAILGFGYAGDLLGASFRSCCPFTAEAVTPVRLRRLPRRRFDALVDGNRDLRSQLLTEISSEMAAAQDQIIHLGRTGARERVATFLLNIARRSGAEMVVPVEIDVPFGRLDIADYLGLTVETVCREISKLKRDGLISTSGPHKIILRRLRGLRDIAGIDDADEPSGDTIIHSERWRYSAKTGEQQHV